MNLDFSFPVPFYIFILLELLCVTYLDVKYKKIVNLWSLLNVCIAAILYFFFSEFYEFSLGSFQYSMVFIIAGFGLFLLKIMGGGDSKFLASFFLIIPNKMQDQVFFYLLISTIFIGILFLLKNIFSNWSKLAESFREKNLEGVKSCFGTKFAYAPVILITWVFIGFKLYY